MTDQTSPAEAPDRPLATGPLAGVRVIDLTTVVAGPYGTQIIADYGADVIKIEPPGGDVMRFAGAKRHEQMGPIFLHANRNKRSAMLDVKNEEVRDAVLALCRSADAVVHNIRPQAMTRLGLDYDAVRRVRPDIVYVNLVGYGRRGPYAGQPAYDDLIQGVSGVASMFTLCGDDTPRYMPSIMADRISGLNIVNAVLAALLHRERTGEGQQVEVPMFEAMVQLVLGDHFGGLSFDPPAGPPGYNRLTTPHRRPYRTSDGFIGVLIYNDRQWKTFLRLIGRMDIWENDPRYQSQAARAENYDEAYAMVARYLAGRSSAEWLALLQENDIPAVPITAIEELPTDRHLLESGFMRTVEHPTEGRIHRMQPPVDFDRTPAGVYRHAPNPGEHTREILAEAGLQPAAIDALLAQGAAWQFEAPGDVSS